MTVYFADKQLVPSPSLRQTHRELNIEEPEETQELVALTAGRMFPDDSPVDIDNPDEVAAVMARAREKLAS